MQNIVFKRLTPQEVAESKGFSRLLEGYSSECANQSLGAVHPDMDLYELYHNSGMLGITGAFDGERLIGVVAVLVSPLAHFSQKTAVTESFYLAPEYRGQGLGRKLLAHAMQFAASKGVKGLYVSAPTGSRLERIAKEAGLRQTNSVFFVEV